MSAGNDVWELWYWDLAGRGEFVRLLFEDAGEKYVQVNTNTPRRRDFRPCCFTKQGGPRESLYIFVAPLLWYRRAPCPPPYFPVRRVHTSGGTIPRVKV